MINTINRAIAKRREEGENDKGFTLIELLVVVLIIGILAAIAIPAFLSQREGAWKSAVESDLKNAALAAESYASANNGSFDKMTNGDKAAATATKLSIKDFGFNPTDEVTVVVDSTAKTTYTLTGTHKQLGTRSFVYSSVTGKITESK